MQDEETFNFRSPEPDVKLFMKGMDRLPQALADFGYTGLREGQAEAVNAMLSGQDTIFIFPTAWGKSSTFVIPALCHDWRLLVFSPLKALMRDQVRSLQSKGICALALSSDNRETENSRAIADWVKGDCKILFVAPERLKNEEFARALKQAPPQMVVTDECQCLSNWGDNFRHSYKYIGNLIERYNPRVVAACTATLPKKFEADVRKVMRIPVAKRIFHFPQRLNLKLSSSDLDAYNDLPERVQSIDGKVLVYCGSQEKTVNTANALSKKLREEVGFYHADVQEATKKMNQDGFYCGRIRVMCATNAFGMGIDIEDIRSVIHLSHPADPEALSQEIGRAGRDGKDSWCHTYESRDAMRMNEGFILRGHPSEDYYTRVFRFMEKKADKEKMFHLTGKEIEEGSGVYTQYQAAIMQTLLGDMVLEDVADGVRMHKIQFRKESDLGRFIQLEDKVTSSRNGIGALEKDWWHFDMDLLAQRMDLGKATIQKYMKDWMAQGLVGYEAPPAGKAKRIIGDLSLVDFDRLAVKREDAYKRLKYVAGYFTTPDHKKHDYLQDYFLNL